MSERDSTLLVLDILEAARKIKKYTQGYSFHDFLNDEKTIDAVVRNFEIIGEAASRLDQDFQLTHHTIPWRKLKGFRNRLIHGYFGIDNKIIWEIISQELPELMDDLDNIMDTD